MKCQPKKKSQEVLGSSSIILSQSYHGKPPLSSGVTTTPNPHYQRRKIYLCGYHHPNYFTRLVLEVDLFSKV